MYLLQLRTAESRNSSYSSCSKLRKKLSQCIFHGPIQHALM